MTGSSTISEARSLRRTCLFSLLTLLSGFRKFLPILVDRFVPLNLGGILLELEFFTFSNEWILAGSLEGVREVARPPEIRLIVSVAYPVSVLGLFGWKCWFYGLSPVSNVRRSRSPGDLRVLRQPRLSKQACSTRLPSPTFKDSLILELKAHWAMRQHNKNRNFHLIYVQTVKVPPNTNPSRHTRPSLAPCGKRVCLSGDGCRTPTQWHAQRGGTAAHGAG